MSCLMQNAEMTRFEIVLMFMESIKMHGIKFQPVATYSMATQFRNLKST